MKNIFKISILGLLAVAFAFAQQNTLVQTSLSAAITSTQTSFAVGSATGINAASFGVPGSALYVVDPGQTKGEKMAVISVTSTTIGVRRTGNAKAHVSGAMVLVATVPNWFASRDPTGSCTAASTFVTPVLNTETGNQWLCGPGGSWVAGWGNVSVPAQLSAAVVASATGTTVVSGPLQHMSGTNTTNAFQFSVGWNGYPGCIIPDGAVVVGTNGSTVASTRVIATSLSSTMAALKTYCYTWDQTNSKLVGSY
jgi:hypothetical protein